MGVTKTLRDMDVDLEEGEESKKSMEAGVGLMMKKMMRGCFRFLKGKNV